IPRRRSPLSTLSTERYLERFRMVLDYIDAHLAADLSLERLSNVAAFSKYHFHRQFSELVGFGVYRYVQLKRLKRASWQLAFRPQAPVVDIALANGFGGPEAFARAFRKSFGQSPTEFRGEPHWAAWHEIYEPLEDSRNRIMQGRNTPREVKIID